MATVTVLIGGENMGTHTITHSPFVVGRDASCDVTIDNPGISRNQCQFVWDGKRYHIEDMESANGTFHHGHKIRMSPLADGDKINIGKFVLLFNWPPGDRVPDAKGGERKVSEEAPVTDVMKTFKMDARLIHARMDKPGAGPMRASDLARSFAASSPQSTVKMRASRPSALWRAVKFLFVVGVLTGAAYYLLQSLGVIEGI
jgi:predicted component of type VI protein secretion system